MAVYAHSLPCAPLSEWEPLDAHLEAVAERAAEFADKFGAGDWGRAAGLLHDIGKAKPEFQAYLLGKRGSEPHSAEGAKFAVQHYAMRHRKAFDAPIGKLLAFAIAGHHAGLANGRAFGSGPLPLVERLKAACAIEPSFDRSKLPAFANLPPPLTITRRLRHDGHTEPDPFGWAFFVRMLFSALVDADFLETERWYARAIDKKSVVLAAAAGIQGNGHR